MSNIANLAGQINGKSKLYFFLKQVSQSHHSLLQVHQQSVGDGFVP